MKALSLLVVLASSLAFSSCRTPAAGSTAELECICGRPEAAIEACPHSCCATGERNPENSDCVCGGLTLED